MKKEDFGRRELEKVICEQFNIEKITPLINSQITRFVNSHGHSYKDIARALVFFTEIKKGKLELVYGIAIVNNLMGESKEYFKILEDRKKEQLKNYEENKKDNIILKARPKKREISFLRKTESEE